MEQSDSGYISLFVSAQDGLALHARDYGSRTAPRLPVVCLPGLTRTAADFHEVATALAGHPIWPRRVLALDYRGRGLSAHDPRWQNYDVRIEAGDVLGVMTAAGVAEAVFLGTSRGGLIAMAIGAMRPAPIRAVILNDVGPAIEAAGLRRIKGYVGKLPPPRSLDEAVATLKGIAGDQFTAVGEDDWRTWARRTWREADGAYEPVFDRNLMRTLEGLDPDAPLPPLWPLFDGLAGVPILAIRGGNSDLLSEATLAAMQARHPGLETLMVPGQGHAPLLTDAASIARIVDFVAGVDAMNGRR